MISVHSDIRKIERRPKELDPDFAKYLREVAMSVLANEAESTILN